MLYDLDNENSIDIDHKSKEHTVLYSASFLKVASPGAERPTINSFRSDTPIDKCSGEEVGMRYYVLTLLLPQQEWI